MAKGVPTVEDYLVITFRTIICYLLILIIFRLMGKREIGELSILDLVVFIMFGDIAVISIVEHEKPLLHILVPMFLLLLVQVIFSFFSLKSSKFRNLLDGTPTIIINNGKIDERAMRQQRYNFDDLLTQLREQGIIDVNEVHFAILETTGKLSIIKKKQMEKAAKKETAFPLIMDGEVQEESLKQMGQTKSWLLQQLAEQGYNDIKQVSLCTYSNGQFYIDKKSN